MELLLVSGLSGAGKTIALRQLEDCGYLCIDNLPMSFLVDVVTHCQQKGYQKVAVAIDARAQRTFTDIAPMCTQLLTQGIAVKRLFLTASSSTLLQRFSMTRRQHPHQHEHPQMSLSEAIEAERECLALLGEGAHTIDTTALAPQGLQHWIRAFVEQPHANMTLTFESFAFKYGLPNAADLVFDARCLPNPYYEVALRPLTGLDKPVQDYLAAHPSVGAFIDGIEQFLTQWVPMYRAPNRHFLTIAIGCTGGQHRSVYVAHELAKRARHLNVPVLERHRQAVRAIEERHHGRGQADTN